MSLTDADEDMVNTISSIKPNGVHKNWAMCVITHIAIQLIKLQ